MNYFLFLLCMRHELAATIRDVARMLSRSDSLGQTREVKSYINLKDAQPMTFKEKLVPHFRKWWWAHLIAFLLLTLFFVLILLFVAFPKIAQSNIDSASSLNVTQLILSNPSATGFHLFQNSTITNTAPYHPQLDAFNATIALEGSQPYASIEIGHMHAQRTTIAIVDQDVVLTDVDAFTDYNKAVLNQETVSLAINGKTTIHEMAFPATSIKYAKSTSMQGLNKLAGFAVLNFQIKIIPEADGSNMVGNVSIPNPTVMTLSMGNVTFFSSLSATSSSPPVPIGNVSIDNLVLTPGANTLPMRAQVDQGTVVGALINTYHDGMVPMDIVGNTAIYDGQHLPYFEAALQSLTQHVTLDVGSAIKSTIVNLNTTLAQYSQQLQQKQGQKPS